MELSGERRLPASREAVWAALNDPEVLRTAIPGCDSLDKLSETKFEATVTSRIGPVKAKFKDGVLQVTLPKREDAKPRRIEVRAS